MSTGATSVLISENFVTFKSRRLVQRNDFTSPKSSVHRSNAYKFLPDCRISYII